MAVVGPNARGGEIAVKAVVDRFEADCHTDRRLDHAARRNRKQIYEWSEMSCRRDHLNRQVTPQAAVLVAHERGVSGYSSAGPMTWTIVDPEVFSLASVVSNRHFNIHAS